MFNNNQPNENQLNVRIGPEDIVECECGSDFFMPVFKVAQKKTPIIGQKPVIIPVANAMACMNCKKIVDENTAKTKKDIGEKNGLC